MAYPYLFNPIGEWIGFVTDEKEIYSIRGVYVGFLIDGPRIVRKRTYSFDKPLRSIPPNPGRIRVPATIPLPPMMSEITFSMVDILDEEPERLPTRDFDELKEDMD